MFDPNLHTEKKNSENCASNTGQSTLFHIIQRRICFGFLPYFTLKREKKPGGKQELLVLAGYHRIRNCKFFIYVSLYDPPGLNKHKQEIGNPTTFPTFAPANR